MNEIHNPPSHPSPEGRFDPDRAAQLRAEVMETFKNQMRNIERRLYRWLAFLLALALVCIWQFMESRDPQSWILYGILFLVLVEGTVLMKLWYWIVNNKIGVFHEIRLLRLDLALQKGPAATAPGLETKPLARGPMLPKGERLLWHGLICLLAVAIGITVGTRNLRTWLWGSRMTCESTVTLRPDGTGRVQTTYRLVNHRPQTIHEFTIYSGGSIAETRFIPPAESPYTDEQGRKLPVRVEPAGPNRAWVITLFDPVPPGGRFTLRNETETSATREGETWVYSLDQRWGYRKNHYIDTVILPSGAQVVSAEPQSATQEVRDDQPVLRFEGTRAPGVEWRSTVRYRVGDAVEDPR